MRILDQTVEEKRKHLNNNGYSTLNRYFLP